MVFIRVLLIIIIVYYLFKLAGRYLLPFFVISKVRRVNDEKRREYDEYIARKKAEEGKVTVDNGGSVKRSSNADEGEYVDYEEIE